MKEKSLRQLARELGVSASYLAQVKNGKKKPSKSLLSNLDIKVLTKTLTLILERLNTIMSLPPR